MKVAAILAAAGAGRRLAAGRPKALVVVGGKTILRHAFDALLRAWPFDQMIVTAPPGRERQIRRALGRSASARVLVVAGGSTRALSVRNALASMTGKVQWVLIHDAARPLVDADVVRRTILKARSGGGAVAAIPVFSTVKRATRTGLIVRTVDRRGLYLAQTPQVFRKDLLERRYKALGKKAVSATDDAALFDGTSMKVRIVEDTKKNIKMTTQEDLELFKYYLGRNRR